MLKMIFIFSRASAAEPSAEATEVVVPEPEEIVVTGTRSERALGDSPVATKVLTLDDIRASGAEDMADLLEQVPGIDVQRSFLGASVRLQGLDPEHVLVVVDGQRLTGRAGGGIDLSRLPVDAVERVEIVEGAASALYGSDAMGGVIHIITRDPEPAVQGYLRGRGGHLGTADVAGGVQGGSDEVQARLDVGVHGQSAVDRDLSDPATTTSGVLQGQVTGRIDADPTADLMVSAEGTYSRLDSSGIDQSDGGAVFDRSNVQEEVRASVSPRWVPAANGLVSLHLGLSVFRDQYLSDQQGASALDSYADTRDQLGQLSLQVERHAGSHRLLMGVDGIAEWLRSERLAEGRGQRQRGGVFAQDEWRVARGWSLLPSARLDADTSFGVVPTGRLAMRLDPHPTLVVRGAVGTGYRAPSFREQLLLFDNPGSGYRVDGNLQLRPEQSRQVSGSAEWAPHQAITVLVSGFLHDVDDLITVATLADDPGLTRFSYANVARARSAGGEATLSVEPVAGVALGGPYTYTDARDLALDRELEGRARHRGTASLRLDHDATDSQLSSRAGFVGQRSYYADAADPSSSVDRRPGYVLVDVRAEQGLGRSLSAFVGADNLLDAGDADLTPLLPRFFYAGLSAELSRRTPSRRPAVRGVP